MRGFRLFTRVSLLSLLSFANGGIGRGVGGHEPVDQERIKNRG
jgi:hypothetical protein